MIADYVRLILTILVCFTTIPIWAHDGHEHSPTVDEVTHAVPAAKSTTQAATSYPRKTTQPVWIADPVSVLFGVTQVRRDTPKSARHFEASKNVEVRWDSRWLYIESNGLPDHPMMVGITNWQQQVPLPQPFAGGNAWKIPLQPKLADKPISVRKNPLRGAIALAVNGVPIFCALNNRGEDAYLLGELDQWGGHCGKGDDYHYHIAPVHLEEIVGKGNPIAYALDGFPIYGYKNADGSSVGKLDQYNGQFDKNGDYHYHATKVFPYVNGGLRGEVVMRGDQIEQPKDSPLRPATRPLRGAKITGFQTENETSVLTYEVSGRTGKITYLPNGPTAWKFTYEEPNGRTSTETYQRQRSGERRDPPPSRRGGRPPRR